MNCLEIRIKIIQFLFGELTIVELVELRRHLAECAECRLEKEAVEILLSGMSCIQECEPVPPDLKERVYLKLAEDL
jgi:hypothetical protein